MKIISPGPVLEGMWPLHFFGVLELIIAKPDCNYALSMANASYRMPSAIQYIRQGHIQEQAKS